MQEGGKCTLENLRHAPSGINLLRIISHPSVVYLVN